MCISYLLIAIIFWQDCLFHVFFSGCVKVYNLEDKSTKPIHISTALCGKHTDPVWEVWCLSCCSHVVTVQCDLNPRN